MSNNGLPKPFLGHFVAEVQHALVISYTLLHLWWCRRLWRCRLLYSAPSPQGLRGKRKTASLHVSFGNNTYLRGTENKSSLKYPNKVTLASPCPLLPPQSHSPNQVSPQGTVAQGNSPLFHFHSPGHNGIEVSLSQLLWHHWQHVQRPIPSVQTLTFSPSNMPSSKVPNEYREHIKCTLDMTWSRKGLYAPASQPAKWVSLLTYPLMASLMVHSTYASTLRILIRP